MKYKVDIQRTYYDFETLSELDVYCDDQVVFSCKGLEPPKNGNKKGISCINEDDYIVTKRKWSEKHPYPHFYVQDKRGREAVLWHVGNFRKDTHGCYLPGDTFADRDKDGFMDVLNSKATLKKLWDILPDEFVATYREKNVH